jgi:hypothetical protein
MNTGCDPFRVGKCAQVNNALRANVCDPYGVKTHVITGTTPKGSQTLE